VSDSRPHEPRLASTALGSHLLLDFYGCAPELIDDLEYLKDAMLKAAELAEATVVNHTFHRFSPQGVSGVVVIAESHLALHTWPEYGCVSVDLFTCSPLMRAEAVAPFLKEAFAAQGVSEKKVLRGERSGGLAAAPTAGSPTAEAPTPRSLQSQ